MSEQDYLDLDVLLIAADIVDETGRDAIANQLRRLHQELRNSVIVERINPPKQFYNLDPDLWHTLLAIQNAQHEHRLHSAGEVTELIQE